MKKPLYQFFTKLYIKKALYLKRFFTQDSGRNTGKEVLGR